MDLEQNLLIDADRLREVMALGGRAEITVRSRNTGKHVRVVLTAKQLKANGGYVSRATIRGRVGIEDADTVFANDPTLDFHEGGLAALYRRGRYAGRIFTNTKDEARAWTARMLLEVARGNGVFPDACEVFLATKCAMCGHSLTDPESITRGIGPECYGRATESQPLPHHQTKMVAA